MFGLKRSTYRFDLLCSDNITSQEVKDADALINYVIGVNNHLLDQEDTGWLFVEKVKESKKGSDVLYAAKIDLPLLEENRFFDQLLAPFYTRKKRAFEAVTPIVVDEKEEPSGQAPSMPESLAHLASIGEKQLQETQVEEPTVVVESEELEPVKEELVTSFSEQEQQTPMNHQKQLDELTSMVKLQQQEIERMKQSEREYFSQMLEKVEKPVSNQKQSNQQTLDTSVPIHVEEKELFLKDSVAVTSENQPVNEVLEMVKKEFSHRLIDFAKEEMEKINAEIKQMDTRHTIERDIHTRLQQEKNKVVERESAVLETEKTSAIQEENARHEAAVLMIEETYTRKKAEKLKEVGTIYEEKIRTEVTTEYQRQTDQLAKILEGKKEELLLRQKELNEGLKNDFSQVLATFNQSHNQVIQQLENQKDQNQPIDFLARLKEA